MANIPVTNFPSHQLSNGLYVSGRPDQHKEKAPTMTSSAMPYTGGDVKKSGELGKMFDIAVEASKSKKSGPIASGGSFRGSSTATGGTPTGPPRSAFSTSGPLNSAGMPRQNSQKSNSGPLTGGTGSRSGNLSSTPNLKTSGPIPNPLKTSGPINLPATGLITSTGAPRKVSGPLGGDAGASFKLAANTGSQAVNNLSHDKHYSYSKNIPRAILWTVIPLFVMGFIAGAFILAAVKNPVLLIIITCLFVAVLLLLLWNTLWGKKAVLSFADKHPDAQLATAKDGQYVKVTGVVTCGSVHLESPFQKVNRCIYTSASLHEYRAWHSKPANDKHQRFTWGLRHLERHIVDFYISDFNSGFRALVKAGYSARVSPYVEESKIVEVPAGNHSVPSDFTQWLTERNLSRDDRRMRLTEGYIKEGSSVTVMGVVQRNDNVVMIIPPPDAVSTGCQWPRLLLPVTLEGIVVTSQETSFKVDVA
ncbi:uncharacterized membrane protein At1g16860 [Selaginella moellendorffii]|uniref:uncharacterized membrane protein At1g16860 n=1 Tax=Selaginella moellendorffii TaxID=88036 RepID=UPI000D1D03EB|nr:uncharacterized membrane protein At1g16860 [Selaginella moellendorffii]|eukprot:XP_024529916.1 uncharacterized membrane protein At1g16860 [Selaginella moellendorffii]